MSTRDLAFSLVSTVRHDGDGGVADDLDTVQGLARWTSAAGFHDVAADDDLRQRLIALRRAIRSLFARAVHPAPPSRADAANLLPADAALARLNETAARLGPPRLEWPAEEEPRLDYPMPATGPVDHLLGTVAVSAIGFLLGPDRHRLRACPAPRCVRYFLQDDPRQAWCKPSCGNRARVARHYQRHHGDAN